MQGSVRIITESKHHVLLVDRSVLLHDDDANRYSVVVMTRDSLALLKTVEPGIQNDSLVEVRSTELRPGMTVIRKGNYALSDSVKVAVQGL